MTTFSKEFVEAALEAAEKATDGIVERDPDDGSILVRTKFYNWMDGTYHDTQEPDEDDEDSDDD